MVYFVFDMDETLAELYSMFYFIASLRLKEEDNSIPDSLKDSLAAAYNIFVEKVINQETSAHRLGVLRPGILKIMEKLNSQRDIIDGVIIYSNNGHLESLEFIRDLIHKYLNTTTLIKDCIHWDHHMRENERNLGPNAENKTWQILKSILVEGPAKASPSLLPAQVYFFDDLDHPDLQRNLRGNYYKVPPYRFKASFDRIALLYKDAINLADVDTNLLYKYVANILIDNESTTKENDTELDKIIRAFKAKTPGTASLLLDPPHPDTGIALMATAIGRAKQIGGGNKRKRHLTKSRTKKRTRHRSQNAKYKKN
jgi:hypothetical protein